MSVTYRPERVFVSTSAAPTKDWTITNIGIVNLVNEDLIALAYAHDRRKAGRRIRQQRRKVRRMGMSESILRAKVVFR